MKQLILSVVMAVKTFTQKYILVYLVSHTIQDVIQNVHCQGILAYSVYSITM